MIVINYDKAQMTSWICHLQARTDECPVTRHGRVSKLRSIMLLSCNDLPRVVVVCSPPVCCELVVNVLSVM